MNKDIPLTSDQIETAIKEAEVLLHEKRYEDMESIAVPLIPLIPYHAYETRLRVYHLLVKDPLFSLCDPERDDLRRSTLEVMNDKEMPRTARLLAHVLYCYTGKIEPQEQYEIHAIILAEEILRDTGSAQSERLLAHFLLCHRLFGETKEERDAIKGHLGELERMGDEHVFLLGCKAASPEFHFATGCADLNRAIVRMCHSAQKAQLLEKKLGSLVFGLIETEDGSDREAEWVDQWIDVFQETYRDFLEHQTTTRHRVLGELFLAIYATRVADDMMGEFHFMTADELARRHGQQNLIDFVDSFREYLAQVYEMRRAEDESEYDEDDDEGEEWKRELN